MDAEKPASPPPPATASPPEPTPPAEPGSGPPQAPARASPIRRLVVATAMIAALIGLRVWLWPRIEEALHTVSTDDAYVAAHVTYVAPRVAGSVAKVLVDDDQFVKAGELLVELDPEPYRVAVARAEAALKLAEAQTLQARSQGRAIVAKVRGAYNGVRLARDQVVEQVAKLKASVATLAKARAQADLAGVELTRARNLLRTESGTQQVVDQRNASYLVAEATVREAEEQVRLNRAALGRPPDPPAGRPLDDVPADWDQKAPAVRAALADLINAAVMIGVELPPIEEGPEVVYAEFVKKSPGGDLDRYLNQLVDASPGVLLALAGVEQAGRALDQAKLDLGYTKIAAEVAGFVSRRIVNVGNRVQAGQGMMAIRPLDEVWIDANFKETQLADLRIGQPVEIRADAYPGRVYRGRISGFGAGTGASTALLPPENATGNFVKVVQRLPVRIDLVDGNPHEAPLFVGLSVEPRVLIRERPSGPFAGGRLQVSPRPAADATKGRAEP
ncbi:HlyD family secretion protein [Paludisphaera mucosa]|uniref:HlyD family secretion protein n=1 Tax=Paludisphaera mucosa TaxID=3030827 RepID=A0ABT6FJA9_9BACT|nr:HlyD family secretion protein [Paludisphaera mucosa]MDG3007666.1 HlyD family secretion protein [Paludisphaera mucosa]